MGESKMTIAVLSWNARETLTQSLESYREFGLDQLDDEKIIYFQEISEEDIAIAHNFGYKWIGSTDNVGIAEGYKALVEEATGEFFLFLENDWKLLRDPKSEFTKAQKAIKFYGADIVRLRDRKNPGNPLWTRQFEGHEEERPTHLLDSIHWTEDPTKFDAIIRMGNTDMFLTTSKYANWTNNPHMAYTDFLRENIVPHLGSGDLERDIQSWWEKQEFTVAQGEGLFTHVRID